MGGDIENELTLAVLRVCEALAVKQPSISVRTCVQTTEALWGATVSAITHGGGNPAIFNDEVIIRALTKAGIEERDAKNYGIVGCYEPNPGGCTYGATTSGFFHLHDVLTEFLSMAEPYSDFDEFFRAFLDFFREK